MFVHEKYFFFMPTFLHLGQILFSLTVLKFIVSLAYYAFMPKHFRYFTGFLEPAEDHFTPISAIFTLVSAAGTPFNRGDNQQGFF